MNWHRTNCFLCTQIELCPAKTKLNINYCGSQRNQNKALVMEAMADCLSRRGLNYLRITVNSSRVAIDRRPSLQPVFSE
jgi:hypothetical protein